MHVQIVLTQLDNRKAYPINPDSGERIGKPIELPEGTYDVVSTVLISKVGNWQVGTAIVGHVLWSDQTFGIEVTFFPHKHIIETEEILDAHE